MESLLILVPVAIVFVAIAVKIYFWAVNNRQFDNLEAEGRRILFDDDIPQSQNAEPNTTASSPEASATEVAAEQPKAPE